MTTFHIIYKITNELNGKIYIGAHSTRDVNDSYMGSGVALKEDISACGLENFKKEILYIFDSAEEMYIMESLCVNREFVDRADTYNLKLGGHGGWDHLSGKPLSNDHKEKLRRANVGKILSDDHKEKLRRANVGKTAGDETKQKMSASHSGKKLSDEHKRNLSGAGNGNYKTICITNGKENLRVRNEDLIPDGWFRGTTFSKERNRKVSISLKGVNHPQFGKMYITDGKENRLILKDQTIPDGWRKGRTT